MSEKYETAETTAQANSDSVLRALQALHGRQEQVVLLRSLKQQLFGDRAKFMVGNQEYQINVKRDYPKQPARSHNRRGVLAMPYYMVSVAMLPEDRKLRKEDIVTAFTFDPYQPLEDNRALIDGIGGGADTQKHADDMAILAKGLAALEYGAS